MNAFGPQAFFTAIVLVERNYIDLQDIEEALDHEFLRGHVLVLTTRQDVRRHVKPGEKQVLYILPDHGKYDVVFNFSRDMKELNPELEIGWLDDEPFLRHPINRLVTIGHGNGPQRFDNFKIEIAEVIGYAPFQV